MDINRVRNGKWKFLHIQKLQAKLILGFGQSVGIEDMTFELIHLKFMDKLQLVWIEIC